MKKNRDVDLLYEIGCIRFIKRSWQRFLNTDFQNLAEHHYRVAWIALILAKGEGVLNTDKILKMAIIHDIGESRTGDCDYLSRQYVERKEDLAMKDILDDTSMETEFTKLWQEYTKRESIESKIVKDADLLDVDLELKEQSTKGNILSEIWAEQRKFISKNKLYTKTAKEIWKELQKTNPHNWHVSGRTRFSKDGDWKK